MIRTKFFVKPKLQAKILFQTLLLVLIASACVLFVVWKQIYEAEWLVGVSGGELARAKEDIFASWMWITGIILAASLLQNLFFFHRLVGPIYVMERIAALMAEGHMGGHIHLRRKDEFRDLAKSLETVANRVRETVSADRRTIQRAREVLEEVSSELERTLPGGGGEVRRKLEEVRQQLAGTTQWFRLED